MCSIEEKYPHPFWLVPLPQGARDRRKSTCAFFAQVQLFGNSEQFVQRFPNQIALSVLNRKNG